jgi:hypothetical protein
MLTHFLASKHADRDDSDSINSNKTKNLDISHIELPSNSSLPTDRFAGMIEYRAGQAMQAPNSSDGIGLTPSLLTASAPLLQQTAASHHTGVSRIVRYSDCGIPSSCCSVSGGALSPQLATRSELPSSCFISNMSFPQPAGSRNGSAMYPEQARVSTRPVVFGDADFIYTSVAFKALIFLDVLVVAIPFILVLGSTCLGSLSATNMMLRVWFLWPLMHGPRFIWFPMVILFSRVTKR